MPVETFVMPSPTSKWSETAGVCLQIGQLKRMIVQRSASSKKKRQDEPIPIFSPALVLALSPFLPLPNSCANIIFPSQANKALPVGGWLTTMFLTFSVSHCELQGSAEKLSAQSQCSHWHIKASFKTRAPAS